jgi:aspartyl/asparaginyl-tRNA synthetase
VINESIQPIGQSLYNFQSALNQNGDTLENYLNDNYFDKWLGDNLYHVLALRTTLVNSMHNFLTNYGLFNIERVSLSPITDPLAHDVEHVPSISYKGHSYKTTHSMIYSKFLACMNQKIKGIFVDSPNIRLEIESPVGKQRGKYVIDFSQMDIEIRRNRNIQIDEYKKEISKVTKILKEDFEEALLFFEKLLIHSMTEINNKNESDLRALDIAIEVPKSPFPRFKKDEVSIKYGNKEYEKKIGEHVNSQFFWITGLMRENYDLIYPYLLENGNKIPISEFTSDMVFNYDLCAKSLNRKSNKNGMSCEILSGAIREWLYEPIIERLIDNKVLLTRPEIINGNLENIDEIGGYGPFLMAVNSKDKNGNSLFPDTFGGGIGIERTLYALCLNEKIKVIDDVTLFGKNPDSHPIYMF